MEEKDWKTCLTKEQYKILRKKGTELPFTGKLLHNKESGTYMCAACKSVLFSSKAKFDSGTGWPSFFEANRKNIVMKEERGFLGKRIEVMCKKCGGHLGHVFDDGPMPTGKRYCINSAALEFRNSPRTRAAKRIS